MYCFLLKVYVYYGGHFAKVLKLWQSCGLLLITQTFEVFVCKVLAMFELCNILNYLNLEGFIGCYLPTLTEFSANGSAV